MRLVATCKIQQILKTRIIEEQGRPLGYKRLRPSRHLPLKIPQRRYRHVTFARVDIGTAIVHRIHGDRETTAASAFSAPSHVGFLPITLNGQDTCALVDSAASDCFVREKFLTPNIQLENVQCIIRTACKNRDMIVRNACMLPLTIGEHTE